MDSIDDIEAGHAEAAEASSGPDRDRKLIRQVARVISGMDKAQWKELGREGQKPHLATARRVLNTIERLKARRAAGAGEAGQDDEDL
ncbi:hypothetical protein ruthe_01550 [Rubellimicrobium thermophilum DSM 16684]|uniref:Uncharacterized protein n=1 Tax=Rubellimicrobium thermophilum DSM 16684 TaxID=1123069 RepID=S9S6K2_9RHOB|nr:hypothetical protein [Rubellimicrobium thermophilum]EPX85830.1 hypothetical protein ruthe_01550 [Rubellimicrobium thermophilum DSM 16684]